ncbi:uncharacterized protein GO595_000315 [Histomonas meleagridis]|uniref:uncharacterized protein n=1 Tax=Histomonas meleagridis TaxID=135588 RepID=UPI00355A2E30|nr:hypothetical protein GO595_000315 [Histomonas meleagridis]
MDLPRILADPAPTPSPSPIPDLSQVPSVATCVITCIVGIVIIACTVLYLCIRKQEDDALFDSVQSTIISESEQRNQPLINDNQQVQIN